MKLKNNKRAQQEIVGFVLIVIIVVVGMMIFLVISLRTTTKSQDSLEASNMLSAIMRYTTECAVISEKYLNLKDLFKSCRELKQCNNLGKDSCEYLNESLKDVMSELIRGESTIDSYQLNFFEKDDEGRENILMISEGNCAGEIYGAQDRFTSKSKTLFVELKICKSV